MTEPKLTIPRACLANGAYQLAWGIPMLLQGAGLLSGALGDYPALGDPIVSTWIRLVGVTLLGMTAVNVALSRVTDPAAQRWIRFGWIAFWANELLIDGLLLQLPAFLQGAKHLTLAGILVTLAGRTVMLTMWLVARPIRAVAVQAVAPAPGIRG